MDVTNGSTSIAPRRSGATAWDALTIAGILAIIALAAVLHFLRFAPNYDADWLLIASRRMLAGGHYLVDFDEISPPMILMLLAPVSAFAKATGLDAYTVFVVAVCLLVALCLWLSSPVVAWCLSDHPVGYRVALLGIAVVLALEPGFRFGQREHLIVLLVLPGIFWFAAREAGRPSPMDLRAGATFVLATIGLLIKPYYFLIPVAFLIVRWCRVRSWRAALLDAPVTIIVAGALLFGLMVLLFFPEYLGEIRLENSTYGAWGANWRDVIDHFRDAIAALCILVLLSELVLSHAPARVVLRHLSLAVACALLIAIVQKKGWAYHMMPALEIAAIGLIIAAVLVFATTRADRVRTAAVAGALLLIGALIAMRPAFEAITNTRSSFGGDALIAALRQQATNQPVMLLTSGLQAGFPSLAHVELAARHPGQPMLPGTVKLENGTAEDRRLGAALRHTMTELTVHDLEHFKPLFVAVDRNHIKQALPNDFDILAYFTADPAFSKAWSDYHLVTSVPGWDLYERAGK